MTWRSILISKGGKLSLQHNQLHIQQKDGSHTVPLEDIAVIVVDTPETVITAPLLSALAQQGCTLLTCDQQFPPCGQWLPFSQYHRQLKTLKLQLNATQPQKKQLWQKIVRQKILNQAFVANETGSDLAAERLRNIATQVKSGDKDNLEAQAAALYFQAAFGSGFSRKQAHSINTHLNYAYSILRSAIARHIIRYGWLPALGLHHRSELNPFNLADDFIEPFRPIADLLVWHLQQQSCLKTELDTESKQRLIKVLHHQISWNGQTHSVLTAADRCISTFQAALQSKNADLLQLPEMLPLKEHQYE